MEDGCIIRYMKRLLKAKNSEADEKADGRNTDSLSLLDNSFLAYYIEIQDVILTFAVQPFIERRRYMHGIRAAGKRYLLTVERVIDAHVESLLTGVGIY